MGDVLLDKISTVHQYFKTNVNKSTGRVLQIGLELKNRNSQNTVFGNDDCSSNLNQNMLEQKNPKS